MGPDKFSTVLQFAPPSHLRKSPLVMEALRYHREVYLTREKARLYQGKGRVGGDRPRLQGASGFTKWDGHGELEMKYHSLVEVPLSARTARPMRRTCYMPSGASSCTRTSWSGSITTARSDGRRSTRPWPMWKISYDFDPTEHFTLPNPDHESKDPGAIAPDDRNIRSTIATPSGWRRRDWRDRSISGATGGCRSTTMGRSRPTSRSARGGRQGNLAMPAGLTRNTIPHRNTRISGMAGYFSFGRRHFRE